MIRTVIAGLMSTDNDDHRATGDALREKQNWTLRFDEFERGNKRFGFTVDACCDSSGRNALLKTFWDAFWEDVELQHTAAAMQAWGCVDDTSRHTCTALEYVTYVELQQAAAAVQAWGCIATRGYATRVRVRHMDNRARVRGHHSCTGSPRVYATLDATISTG
jgi:hypothetical protein